MTHQQGGEVSINRRAAAEHGDLAEEEEAEGQISSARFARDHVRGPERTQRFESVTWNGAFDPG